MPQAPVLSHLEARKIALEAQGLAQRAPFAKGAQGALQAIEHLGYVQIDTISIVERAHHHVLWSRVPDYTPRMLESLMTPSQGEPRIFEYWSHAAAYLPVRDFRFALPRMERHASGARHWFKREKAVRERVLARIRAEGPLMARDFEAPAGKRAGPWFEWKPAKKALEQLFWEGALLIRERRGFQKVFDLRERVLPGWVAQTMPTPREHSHFLIERGLRSHGLVRKEEIRYLTRDGVREVKGLLEDLLDEGSVCEVRVRGLEKQRFFVKPEALRKPVELDPGARILSPFDSFAIQRKRLKALFGFDYTIECYVPAPKRKHGYFCLPLLWRGELVGRIDAKADRKAGRLEVQKLIYEPGRKHRGALAQAVERELKEFGAFNGCSEVRVLKIADSATR